MGKFPKILLIILAAGFLLRLFLFLVIITAQGQGAFLVSDSGAFIALAKNLIAGNGFSQSPEPPFLPSAHFPPLYPLILAGSLGVSDSLLPAIILQLIVSGALPLLVWLIAKKFTARTDVPLIAAGLMAFEPVAAIFGLLVTTDTLAVFFLLLASLFFIRTLQKDSRILDVTLGGVFLGISTLAKPNAQLLFLVWLLVLAAFWFKKRLRPAFFLAFTLAFFMVLSPWIARNFIQFGSPSISATGPRNIYTDFAVSVVSYETGRPYGEVEEELKRSFAENRGLPYSEINTNPALGKELAQEGFKIIISHPRSSLMVLSITLQAFFTQDLYLYFSQKFHLIRPMTFDFSPSVVLLKEGPLALTKRVWELLEGAAIIPILGRLVWIALTLLAAWGGYRAYRSGNLLKAPGEAGREKMKLHGQARRLPSGSGGIIGLPVEQNPAPKTTSHPSASPWSSGARIVAIFMALTIFYYAMTSAVAAFSDQGRHRYPADAFIMILAAYGVSEIRRHLNFRRGALR